MRWLERVILSRLTLASCETGAKSYLHKSLLLGQRRVALVERAA